MNGAGHLLQVLAEPAVLDRLDDTAWDDLIPVARANRLLARLEPLARDAGCWDRLPGRARNQIRGSLVLVEHQQLQIRRELREVRAALAAARCDAPLLLLKGAAYLEAALPPGRGRPLADLDLLVPRARLEEVEAVLQHAGWHSDLNDPYDQHYYRAWMHEIPPLRHRHRSVEVDLHHNLLPLTGRLQVPAEALWEAAHPLEEGLWHLAPADLLLHSATHLLVSDELRGGLRDLFDLHQLYLYFCATEPDFPDVLRRRAARLGLGVPLWHALQAARTLFRTPVEPTLLDPHIPGLPGRTRRRLLQHLFLAVLRPRAPGRPPPAVRQWLLYVRSHWLRMPPGLLMAHLGRKSLRRWRKRLDSGEGMA